MSRRRRERALAPRPPEPLDREQALARHRRLFGRGVRFGFLACGPLFEAASHEELARRFQAWLKSETKGWPS